MTSAATIIYQIIPYHAPAKYFSGFAPLEKPIVYFDSASHDITLGRYSYIAVDPFDVTQDLTTLKTWVSQFQLPVLDSLPPFQGGFAGYFSYDLARQLEKLPNHADIDIEYPPLEIGAFDVVLSFDHLQKKAWMISTGMPEQNQVQRQQRAKSRLTFYWNYIQKMDFEKLHVDDHSRVGEIKSNFTESGYCAAIEKVIDYIEAGDIFEANLSQRFQATIDDDCDVLNLYQRLCQQNPAPFAAYIDLGNTKILSSSPERFIQLQDRHVETRPIKGTIKRSTNADEDKALAQQLLHSVKDHAENTMIVDLMRNDLSRVCKPHTVKVPQLCGLESYAAVHHLVSVVTGELEAQYNALDLLMATFPGGSITGAPKIRAMEIIDELEPTRRGPYCGSALWLGFNGNLDSSILIRTLVVKDRQLTFQGGGAIVLDSNPANEYAETLVKVKKLQQVLKCHDLIN